MIKESIFANESGEFLSSLLKKCLGDRLGTLEQKNKKEINDLYLIKETTNKIKKILKNSIKTSNYFNI